MFIRTRGAVPKIDWGGGESDRLLVEADGMGFAVAHTVVRAGSSSRLAYLNHLEACYCISGSGWVENEEGSVIYVMKPGVLYALDQHDAHVLCAAPTEDLELISVFNPPIRGDERHVLVGDSFSSY